MANAHKTNYGTYATAIALATIGATVSLSGLVAMFGLAFLPIGLGLEVAKLVAARRLHQGNLHRALRATLFGLVAVCMAVTTGGVHGFITPAAPAGVGPGNDPCRAANSLAGLLAVMWDPFAVLLLLAPVRRADEPKPVSGTGAKPITKPARKARKAKRKAALSPTWRTANDNVLRFPRPA